MTETTLMPIDQPVEIYEPPYPDDKSRLEASVSALSGGGYVVTWSEYNFGGSALETEIHMQRFNADGTTAGADIVVNTTTDGQQRYSHVIELSSGDIVVAWYSDSTTGSGAGTYFQRFDSAGVAQGSETFVASDTSGVLTALSGGGFAITWSVNKTIGLLDDASILMQKYTALGAVDGAQTLLAHESLPTSGGLFPAVAFYNTQLIELTGGNLALSFDRSDNTDTTARLGIFTTTGTVVAAPVAVEQTIDNSFTLPQEGIVALGNGNVLIVYGYSHGTTGAVGVGYGEVYGRIYDASGVAQGAEFAIATGTANRRYDIFASGDGNGGALVGWVEEQSDGGKALHVQNLSQTGTLLGDPMWLDETEASSSRDGIMTVLASGDIVGVFQNGSQGSHSEMFIRMFANTDSTGFTSGNDTVTLGALGEHVAALEGDDTVTGGAGDDIINGGSGIDTLSGEGGADNISGGTGNDIIDGGIGDDFLWGGAGDDTITTGLGADYADGGLGDDTITGGSDADILVGGAGADTINGGDGDDEIYGFRQLGGELGPGETDFDDTVHNTLNGGAGNDRIYGGNGTDTITGGDGDDSLFGDVGYLNGGPGGDDVIYTGNGQNVANGGSGNDTIIGGIDYDRMYGGSGTDSLYGREGNDRLYGQDGNDTIFGEDGNDSLYGEAGDDYLDGGDGDDNLYTSIGNDTLIGGLGRDTVYFTGSTAALTANLSTNTFSGGFADTATISEVENIVGTNFDDTITGDGGDNTLTGADGNDTLAGGLGNDILYGGNGNDVLYTGDGDDYATGGDGNDSIVGGSGVDDLTGGDGDDILYGYDGDDTLDGDDGFNRSGNDTLVGGNGNDTLRGGYGADTLNGGDGDDTIYGGSIQDDFYQVDGGDTIYAGSGDDTIYAQSGDDTVIAEAGNDFISGGVGNDLIYAGAGANTVYGGDDNDTIVGGELGDTLNGDAGNDGIYGQDGDDNINGGDGNDGLSGQAGNDTINGGAGVDILSGADGNDILDGGTENDLIYAGTGDDTLIGGIGDDVLFAGDGTDDLTGGVGNDRLYGQAGTNNLYGGAGDDNYYGGSGVDTYQFNAADGAATERVSLFQATDIIQLNGFGFADAGAAASSFVQSGGNVVFNSGGVQIVFYGATLADVQAAVQVDGLAELPSVDKHIVSEMPDLPQDAIADLLGTASIFAGEEAKIDDGFDGYLLATDLIDGHGFDLM